WRRRTQGSVRSQEDGSDGIGLWEIDFSGPGGDARRDACGPRKTAPMESDFGKLTSQGLEATHAGMRAVPGSFSRLAADGTIQVGTPVAIELPVSADLANLIKVQVGHNQLVLVFAPLRENSAIGIAKVGRTKKLADVPRRFCTNAVDRTDKVTVGHGVTSL